MDYLTTFTVRVPYTARNEDQAKERSDHIADWLTVALVFPDKKKRPWLGDVESEQEGYEEV